MENLDRELIVDEMSQKIVDTAEEIAHNLGVENVNVRKLMQVLDITNRVFYNRFHNIEEVLDIIYQRTSLKIRESILSKFDPNKDFFEQVKNIVADTLIKSYENKENLNQFIFESDSQSASNFSWWKSEIEKLINFGKENNLLKDIETEKMSYAIWCFIRGYNADALGRNLPKEQAVEDFKYSFGVLLDGMRK
ncbi:MAG: TetR/AcrR family transcriptional regulator [Clostridiales bacterium]|nr:TetR/AcrR family transcriptional regulator [Clostridiales bacterium]